MYNTSVKLISINTWKGEGDYVKRMNILAAQLIELKPQVVACQECFMTPDNEVNTVDFLARKLKMNAAVTTARYKIRNLNNKEIHSYSGLGVLSSYPLAFIKEIELPTTQADGGRKAQLLSVKINNQNLLLANIHLSHIPGETALRNQQLETVVSEMNSLQGFRTKIICGDFNAEQDSPELTLVQSRFRVTNCFEKKIKIHSDNINTFQISKRIDHILALPDSNGRYPICSDSLVVLYEPDIQTGLYASDHAGITTTLHLTQH